MIYKSEQGLHPISVWQGEKKKAATTDSLFLFDEKLFFDPHLIERTVNKYQGDQQESDSEIGGQVPELCSQGDFHG